jgi:methyl-accepting chemotaxis protein
MSTIPERLPSVERLIQRVSTAEKSNQKEIRITIQEGKELVNDLALITGKLSQTINQIHSKLDKLSVSTQQIDVKMDGGTF